MSKSYNNTINLSDSPAELKKKINMMITDPARITKTDKGHPSVCTVFAFHKIFNGTEVENISPECKSAKRGCCGCKKKLLERLEKYLAQIQKKRKEISDVDDILEDGAKRAKKIAQATLQEAKKAMGLL